MNLKKTLKRKFYLKYFTLVFLLLLYVPIIGLIVTQFAYKDDVGVKSFSIVP